ALAAIDDSGGAGAPIRGAEEGQAQSAPVIDLAESWQRYTLTRLHGQGGVGRVWLAHDRQLGRPVAFKEVRPEQADDPARQARFLHEARVTGQLEHPGIVPVYDLAWRADGQQPFYTM